MCSSVRIVKGRIQTALMLNMNYELKAKTHRQENAHNISQTLDKENIQRPGP